VELKTETGAVINPLTGENADLPYSPRQTCGYCHAYETIVQSYHIQQGRTAISDDFDPEHPWALSPGMYGGY